MAFPQSTPVSAGDTGRISQYNILRNDMLAVVPLGTVLPYAGDSAPDTYLLCDGAEVSRETYADLFAVIGTKYGAGNGSTTFNLPNLKGRIPLGLDPNDSDFNDRGKSGGAKTHTLTEAEMPSHDHQLQYYAGSSSPISGLGLVSIPREGGGQQWYDMPYSKIVAKGGGGAHNNLQPYLVMNFIIKAKLE